MLETTKHGVRSENARNFLSNSSKTSIPSGGCCMYVNLSHTCTPIIPPSATSNEVACYLTKLILPGAQGKLTFAGNQGAKLAPRTMKRTKTVAWRKRRRCNRTALSLSARCDHVRELGICAAEARPTDRRLCLASVVFYWILFRFGYGQRDS